jgi:hypothetical protein
MLLTVRAFFLALESTGSSSAASTPMMAMTTSISINVNAEVCLLIFMGPFSLSLGI